MITCSPIRQIHSPKVATEGACEEAQGSNYALSLEPLIGVDLSAGVEDSSGGKPIAEAELGVSLHLTLYYTLY